MFTVPAAIDRAGAPPLQPPTYVGPITLGDLTVDVLMTPYDFSTHFSSGDAVDSYSISATPSGLSFNTNTGVLSGTPDTIANTTGVTVTATNAAGSTPTDAFDVNVIASGFGNALVLTYQVPAGGSVVLPTNANGTYSFDVDWGDGQSDNNITVWDAPETTHTYASAADYDVKISGTFSRIAQGTRTDSRDILIELKNWGNTGLSGIQYQMFYLCGNLNITATDGGGATFSNVTSLQRAFWGIISTTNMAVSDWDVSSVTHMGDAFRGATNIQGQFGNWDIGLCTTMDRMFQNTHLSTENYDELLIGWAGQAPDIQTDNIFHGGGATYSTAAAASRDVLTTTYSWAITDGGPE